VRLFWWYGQTKKKMKHEPCDAGGATFFGFKQDICAIRALCISKQLGENGELTDFCSCKYSRLMFADGDDGQCHLTPSSIIIFSVFMFVAAISFMCALWSLYMLHAAYTTRVLRFNALSTALVCGIGCSFLITLTMISRDVVMMTEDQELNASFTQLFLICRLVSPALFFAVLTTLGLSIHETMLQTLRIPIDERMDQRRKLTCAIILLLFCGIIIPLAAIRNFQIGSLLISFLCVVCWWPFKRLGRRFRQGFPIAHMPAVYRERSFAVSEYLRVATNRILFVLFLRLLSSIFMVISFGIHKQYLIEHFEAFTDCFNGVTALILNLVLTACLTVMIRVRMESAISLQAIAMLISNSTGSMSVISCS
jgi:hypothetical protein